MVMMVAMVVPAMAATAEADQVGNYTLTITDDRADRAYEAYQVFYGTLVPTEQILGDIEWGTGVNGANLLQALKNDTTLGNDFSAATSPYDVSVVLSGYANNDAKLLAFSNVVASNLNSAGKKDLTRKSDNSGYEKTGLKNGYYFVRDNKTVSGQDDTVTQYILRVVNDVSVAKKTDKPESEKKVKENTKYQQGDTSTQSTTRTYGTGFNDTADYNIGDTVPFALYSKVPDMSNYTTYKFAFHDTMSEGLTFDPNSVKVYLANTEITTGFELVQAAAEGKMFASGDTFTIEFADLKTVAGATTGAEIRIEFNATLNEKANIGQTTPGNTNKLVLEFSNNPNDGGSGTGKGPEDKVIVFTYELDVTKVDGQTPTTTLEGAEFKFQRKSDNKWAVVYNGTETVSATDSTVPAKGTIKNWVDAEANASVLTTPAGGQFAIKGLDDGEYSLKETKAPTGYNLLQNPIKVIIKADTSNGQSGAGATSELKAISINVDDEKIGGDGDDKDQPKYTAGNVAAGSVSTDVKNNKGSVLPSTGGIGTTIFYVIGAILVLGAGILLVSKRRMSAN